jgi:outer membrane biogenesis lipoprotein LolB
MSARLAAVALLLLTGCALFPVSEASCRPASWKQRGYDDGYFGNPPQDLRLIGECRRYGVTVSQSEYLEGWRAGYDEWDRLMGSVDFN